jgi:O-6-methylguanine DNA methyltransferase
MSLSKAIYDATRRTPRGKVATYADIAAAAGRPKAWRHVGTVLSRNRSPAVPCHRVIRASGQIGGFGFPGGTPEKARRLKREGVHITGGRVDLQKFRIGRPPFPG